MSRQNIEITRRANAAFNRGDAEGWLEMFAPDAELLDRANAPDQKSSVKGRDGIREAWSLWTAAFDELRADIEDCTDAGDSVICGVHWHGLGKASGISIDVRQFDVFEFQDGLAGPSNFGVQIQGGRPERSGGPEIVTSALRGCPCPVVATCLEGSGKTRRSRKAA
jgi:ketosteroid isomerase-like protein